MAFHKLKALMYLVFCSTMMLCGRVLSTFDSTAAIAAIDAAKVNPTNIDYTDFCESSSDLVNDQLFGCQLQAPNTGYELRVCKLATGCVELVNSSIDFLDMVSAAQLNVVEYSQERISGLKCQGETPPQYTCVGYIEEWLDNDADSLTAKPVKINEKIFLKQEGELIADIKVYQDQAPAKALTVTDLNAIKTWMTPSDGKCTTYKQLCNLQGFFKKTGGFVISSPMIKSKLMLGDVCHSESTDPTTKRVLEVLTKFIEAFTPEPAETPPTSG